MRRAHSTRRTRRRPKKETRRVLDGRCKLSFFLASAEPRPVTTLFLLAFLAGLRGVFDGKGPQYSSYDDIGWDGGRSDRRLEGVMRPEACAASRRTGHGEMQIGSGGSDCADWAL